MKHKVIAGLFIALALTSCAQRGPSIRSVASPLQGDLIPGCKNLKDDAQIETLHLGSYRTTWMSALIEGATAGVDEGLARPGGSVADAMRSTTSKPTDSRNTDMLDNLFAKARSFCRAYSADFLDVSRAVDEVMPYLQNRIEIADVESGIYLTENIDREHSGAKWKDSYAIRVIELGEGRTGVEVTRFVYISRMGSPYYGAISDGNNEGWILTRVLKLLSEQG